MADFEDDTKDTLYPEADNVVSNADEKVDDAVSINESEGNALKLLDKVYEAAMHGIPKVSPSVETLIYDYWKQFKCLPEDEYQYSKEEFLHRRVQAIKRMQKNQIAKCTTTGILTGFGGVFLLPVTIPADLLETTYIQIRMVAATAIMAGCDPRTDDFKTHVYASWAGIKIAKHFAPKAAVLASKAIGAQLVKIPRSMLRAFSKQLGVKLTKSAVKGFAKSGKLLPIVGSVVGGAVNFGETKFVANRAFKYFVEENPDFIHIRL